MSYRYLMNISSNSRLYVKKSSIHGYGLYAREFINEGEVKNFIYIFVLIDAHIFAHIFNYLYFFNKYFIEFLYIFFKFIACYRIYW